MTAPVDRPIASSTGPCSMWSSRYARGWRWSSDRRASGMRSRSTPFSASASTSRTPWRSTRPRTLSGTRLPLAPDDPSRLREKRAPSSSAKSTTASVTGGVVPLQPAERLDAREHAERPVEPAAVGHRVEVAADDDGVWPRARHA